MLQNQLLDLLISPLPKFLVVLGRQLRVVPGPGASVLRQRCRIRGRGTWNGHQEGGPSASTTEVDASLLIAATGHGGFFLPLLFRSLGKERVGNPCWQRRARFSNKCRFILCCIGQRRKEKKKKKQKEEHRITQELQDSTGVKLVAMATVESNWFKRRDS